MKKRIISVLIMSAMVLGMAGCNGSTEAPQTTTEDSETTAATTASTTNEDVATETTTAADTEESTAETTTASTTNTTTTVTTTTTAATTTTTTTIVEAPEIPEELPTIKTIHYYNNNGINIWDSDGVPYSYNISENVMCIDDVMYHSAGGRTLSGNMLGNIYGLYNVVTKEQYEYTYMGSYNGYHFVYKSESDFDGATFYFGILDSNGEWVLPLSSDYAICDYVREYAQSGGNFRAFVLLRTDSSCCFYSYDASYGLFAYNWKNDTISYITDVSIIHGDYIYTDPDLYNDSILLKNRNNYEFYNINTGEITTLFEGGELYYLGQDVYHRSSNGEPYAILGKDFKKLYDITGYAIENGTLNATENYASFVSLGEDNKYYRIIVDKDGNRVIDPIMVNNTTKAVMSGNYVITDNEVIDCKTGERKTHKFEEVEIISDRIMVKSDDAYYFIDPSDPDTLINPFEIVDKIYTLE